MPFPPPLGYRFLPLSCWKTPIYPSKPGLSMIPPDGTKLSHLRTPLDRGHMSLIASLSLPDMVAVSLAVRSAGASLIDTL